MYRITTFILDFIGWTSFILVCLTIYSLMTGF